MGKPRHKPFARLSKSFEEIQKEIDNLKKSVKDVAEYGLFEAKTALQNGKNNDNVYQRNKEFLSGYINLVQKNQTEYEIVASSDNQEIQYNLFYAEYGAGISSVFTVGMQSGYIPQYTNQYGYWFYKDAYGQKHYINSSEPIRYMYNAKEAMRKQMKQIKKRISANIRTTIKRNRGNG